MQKDDGHVKWSRTCGREWSTAILAAISQGGERDAMLMLILMLLVVVMLMMLMVCFYLS